jgi:hypothetical protein
MALGSTQPLTEITGIFLRVKDYRRAKLTSPPSVRPITYTMWETLLLTALQDSTAFSGIALPSALRFLSFQIRLLIKDRSFYFRTLKNAQYENCYEQFKKVKLSP